MKRDTTRDTFDVRRHFSSVRQQQGRVQLDAEWNEQADIVSHRIATGTVDTVGSCGVPCQHGGFEIEPTADGADLIITPGRIYVEGILCRLDAEELPVVALLVAGTRLQVAPGSLIGVRLRVDDWVEVVSDRQRLTGTRGIWTRVTAVDPSNDHVDVVADVSPLEPFGNLALHRLPTYSQQPDRPEPVDLPPSPAEDGVYLAYLDVWHRHVGVLEEPSIRETALGGPDTATREQVLSQVRLLRFTGEDVASPPHCLDRPQVWRQTVAPSSGRLRARTQPVPPAPDPCEVPPGGGYTRLENQHYRVEVHRGGERDDIEIKWSRDNGSMVTPWTAQDPLDASKLTVESTGRDQVNGLAPGQWIELVDDDRELEGQAGLMVEILDVDDRVLTIDPHGQVIDLSQFGRHPKVRRWDMANGLIGGGGAWIPLEGGIEVHLEVGTYQVGDYWLIPARAYIGEQLGDIEWPRNGSGEAASKPPEGILHHYCKLALVELTNGSFTRLSDCRQRFPDLTDLVHLQMAGGDGQEAMPGDPLPCPLSVVVRNGGCAVDGRSVRFVVAQDQGRLSAFPGGPLQTELDVPSNGIGAASAFWTLPAEVSAERPCLQVEALLLDAAGSSVSPALTFHASQSVAQQVQYAPGRCPGLLESPPVDTVQEGLDALWCNPTLLTAGGQGQQGAPGETLPCALQVAVRNGRWPAEDQSVRFSFRHEAEGIDEANGLLTAAADDNPQTVGVDELVVVTDSFGMARCFWTLPQEVSEPRRCLRVFAHLLDDAGQPMTSYVVFNGDQVRDPSVDAVRVVDILALPDNAPIPNDDAITLDRFAPEGGPGGLIVVCDRSIEFQTILDPRRKNPRFAPRPSIELEIFVPQFLDADGGILRGGIPNGFPSTNLSDFGIAAYAPLVLNLQLQLQDSNGVPGNRIHCQLTESAIDHLRWLLRQLGQSGIGRLLTRLVLDGNFIWQRDSDPPVYIDGESFGRGSDIPLEVVEPRGDRRAGGTLRHWFWLTPNQQGEQPIGLTATVGGTSVRGRVTDPAGAPLPGAGVALVAIPPTSVPMRNATTDAAGNYRFQTVPFGRYRITAQFVGLASAEREVSIGFVLPPVVPTVVEVDGIGPAMETRMGDIGIDDLGKLAVADADDLADRLSIARERAARFIEQAQKILADGT